MCSNSLTARDPHRTQPTRLHVAKEGLEEQTHKNLTKKYKNKNQREKHWTQNKKQTENDKTKHTETTKKNIVHKRKEPLHFASTSLQNAQNDYETKCASHFATAHARWSVWAMMYEFGCYSLSLFIIMGQHWYSILCSSLTLHALSVCSLFLLCLFTLSLSALPVCAETE